MQYNIRRESLRVPLDIRMDYILKQADKLPPDDRARLILDVREHPHRWLQGR